MEKCKTIEEFILRFKGLEKIFSDEEEDYIEKLGLDFDEQDKYKELVKFLQENVDSDNSGLYSSILAFCYGNGLGVRRNGKKSDIFLEKSAKQGYVVSQFLLASCYLSDDDKEGYKEAFYWSNKAAEQGYPPAIFSIGSCYENGEGVAQNPKRAFNWYTKAANLNYAEAQYKLFTLYYVGKGVAQDIEQAYNWLAMAAKQGYKEALETMEDLGLTLVDE